MSGIGRDFYEEHKSEIYATDELIVRKNGNSVAVKPCRYYDKLYDVECPDRMAEIKLKRRIKADNVNLARISQTDLTEVEYLESQERAKIRQSERLIRPLGDD